MSTGRTGPLPQTIGPYIIRERIATGGMATIYRAYHPQKKREYALKVLLLHFTDEANMLKRFRREANTLLNLQHPYILPVYDYGEDGETPYLVMELLDGRTLDDMMHNKPLPIGDVSRLTRQIASALDFAHQQGIIHRDIKPTNILFGENDHPYLADFGVAHVEDTQSPLTASGGFLGTVAYASPEQCRGEQVTKASDIYSLAVMVFKMLTGELPFHGASPLVLMQKHMREAPPNPLSINPKLPVGVYEVLTRALTKLPENRYPTAGKFSEALDEALGHPASRPIEDDDAWLRGDSSPQPPPRRPIQTVTPPPSPPVQETPFVFVEDEDLSPANVFFDDELVPPPGYPTAEVVFETEPPILPPPDPPVIEQPIIRPAPPTRPIPVPRRAVPWEKIGVYGSMVVSVFALAAAAIIAYVELRESAVTLDTTFESRSLGVALDYPSDWHAEPISDPILLSDGSESFLIADESVPGTGPYDAARLVILVQRINPAAVFSVPSDCWNQLSSGPEVTFGCMQTRGYITPAYEGFQSKHYSGIKLPGTLPPTRATLPIILLPTGSPSWLAVIIVHWNDYENAYDLLDQIAQSVRPLV